METDKYISLEHELYEIKQEIVADTYQMKILEKQLNTYQVNLRKTEIIEKEIKSLSDETKIYDKIGRLFVLSNKDEICKNLAENHVGISKDLENQKILYKKYQDMVNDHTKHYNEVLLSKKN